MSDLSNVSLWEETKTPLDYRNRITIEFILNGSSWFLNFLLFIFVRFRSNIWKSLKATIVFVTAGSFILNIPLVVFQFWMVINLQFKHEPKYSIFTCSLFKNFCSSMTSAYQVLPFAVSLYRYRTVVLKGHPSNYFVVGSHTSITFLFILIAILNYPFGLNTRNDVCDILRFSNHMEIVRISSTLFFNILSILINYFILRFVRSFEKNSRDLQVKRVQLTQSLLIQSCIPVIISFPLLLASLEFYFGIPLPHSFATTWYATTFLGPFLMPLSTILGISSTRRELLHVIRCGCYKPYAHKMSTVVTVIVTTKFKDRSNFTLRDDD